MTEKFDYRVTELKTTVLFDFIEEDQFEEFYFRLRQLCEEYHAHLSTVTRKEDVMTYEKGKRK